ncbi:MAG: hypothetical protein WDZ40_03315 [Candidatus Spechtbacterales bacterium]
MKTNKVLRFLFIVRRIFFGNRRRLRKLRAIVYADDFAKRSGLPLRIVGEPRFTRFIFVPTIRTMTVYFVRGQFTFSSAQTAEGQFTFSSAQTAEENLEELREFIEVSIPPIPSVEYLVKLW